MGSRRYECSMDDEISDDEPVIGEQMPPVPSVTPIQPFIIYIDVPRVFSDVQDEHDIQKCVEKLLYNLQRDYRTSVNMDMQISDRGVFIFNVNQYDTERIAEAVEDISGMEGYGIDALYRVADLPVGDRGFSVGQEQQRQLQEFLARLGESRK